MVSYASARGIEVSTTTSLLTLSDARVDECVASGRLPAHRPIRVVLLLLRSNVQHLPSLIRLVRAHGADAIAVQHLWHDVASARRQRCDQPWSGIHVGASGEALPCPKAKTAQRLNRQQLASSTPPTLCRTCSAYERTRQ